MATDRAFARGDRGSRSSPSVKRGPRNTDSSDSRENNAIARQSARRYPISESHASHPSNILSDAANAISGAGAAVGSVVGGAINAVRGVTGTRINRALSSESTHALDAYKRR